MLVWANYYDGELGSLCVCVVFRRKNYGYTGVIMEKKDIKKLLMVFVIVFLVGLALDLRQNMENKEGS